jgi:hypothetical protein
MRSGVPALALRILTEVLMTLAAGHVRRIRRSLIAGCPTSGEGLVERADDEQDGGWQG